MTLFTGAPHETVGLYVVRKPTQLEHDLARCVLGWMMEGKPLPAIDGQIYDEQAELALAIVLATYAEHRRMLGDPNALRRALEHAEAVKRELDAGLKDTDQMRQTIATEIESGRLIL